MDGMDVLGGFSAVADAIKGNLDGNTSTTKIEGDGGDPIVDPTEVTDPAEKTDPIEPVDPVDPEGDGPIELNEEGPIEPVEPTGTSGTEPSGDVDDLSFGDAEPELAAVVHERLAASLGWEIGEDDTKFESIEEVVDYMKSIVEENSAPDYASEDLRKIDEYVRNGGDIRNYISEAYGEVNYDTLDISKESNQKAVITEHLKTKGYSDSRINRMVNRYEDAGTLEEEAEDAIDMLKEHRVAVSEKLSIDQKNQQAQRIELQQKYMQDVENNIEGVSDIRGITISNTEKKKLMDYIFKPVDSEGNSQYKIDYLQNNKNLIESAYFTMKGDALVDKVKRKATSDAARNLKKKLAEKGRRTKDQSTGRGDSSVSSTSIWGLASSQLRKPN